MSYTWADFVKEVKKKYPEFVKEVNGIMMVDYLKISAKAKDVRRKREGAE